MAPKTGPANSRFNFTHVVVSEIPDSYATKALGLSGTVDINLARSQHKAYVDVFRGLGVEVRVLKADEAFPDCVFVEDPAIVIEGHALITKPGDPSRQDEIRRIRRTLRDELQLPFLEVVDPAVKLDGGDVLFTGREILVGLSSRTNKAGVEAVQAAFPGFPVTGIEVAGPLHLKTLLTLCGEDTLCASIESGDSFTMLKRIDAASKFTYRRVLVPDDMAANVVYMNGTVICKSATESPDSFRILKEQLGHEYDVVGIELSEMEKAVGSLTCMSLRFTKPTKIKPGTMQRLVCRYESEDA